MIFEFLAGQLASYGTNKSFNRALDAVQEVFGNEHAFSFACEELREKYEEALAPASYEHVVGNLRLTRDDFLLYFRQRTRPDSLSDHLRRRLRERSEAWVYNRPDRAVFDELVDDFLNAYQRYFLSADLQLTALSIQESSQEILDVVREIRDAIDKARAQRPDEGERRPSPSLAKEIRSFLTVLNVPFEIVEEQPDRIDVLVIDPSSVFPNRFLLCVRAAVDTLDDVDEVAATAKLLPKISDILLVGVAPLSRDVCAHAERRRVSVSSFKEFKETFYRLAPLERYVLGSLAARALAESLNIHEVYIEPDAMPVVPGDDMENRFLDVRQPAAGLVESFLADAAPGVLFVLGGYGSGKSAFCAHLMQVLQASDVTPVYFALRQLRDADDLTKVVTKADQLAKTLGEGKGRALVILDGLDELPNAMRGADKKQNMLRLLEAAARTDKLLVTARTSYFRGMEDFWHLFRRPQDTALWHQMAKSIPEGGRRPAAGAMILREFNTDQIESYIDGLARSRVLGTDFAEEFLGQMKSHDFGFNYMLLARSPLYLFLLVNSRPWDSRDVGCLADIYALFVKYWLERDIEKGRSRWALATEDRFDFMSMVAWKMFQERRHALSFSEFDQCVRAFVGSGPQDEDYQSLALDLQTTGIFNCIGNVLQFFAPGFLDYLVVRRFADASFPDDDPPARLPTVDQVSLWAGLAETRKQGFAPDARAYLERLGIEYQPAFYGRISLDPGRIVYHLPSGDWDWPYLNAEDNPKRHSSTADRERGNLRIVVNAVLTRVEADRWAEIRMLVANPKGLHARAAARVCSAFQRWRHDFIGREAPVVTARREGGGEAAGFGEIMGLMMLAAARGTVLIVDYQHCTRGEVEALLEHMGCRQGDEPGLWLAHLSEG